MKRISIYLVMSLFLLLQSCIKEDLSICESWLLLRFRYTLNNQNSNLFDAEVNKVNVYVFDDKGKYVTEFSNQGDVLTNDYVMRLPLPEGKYNIVVNGGDFTTYSVGEQDSISHSLNETLREGITDISNFRTELKSIQGAENYLYPANVPDDLYSGLVTNVVSSSDNQHITDVELIKITKKIKVKIKGPGVDNMPIDVYILAQNGRYQSDETIDHNYGILKYSPVKTSVQTDFKEVDLKTMRLMLGESPMLVIKNSSTSDVLYNKNMIEQILLTQKYHTQADIDREDEFVFEIVMEANGNNIEITVFINGWKINIVTPDLK